jgi:zinc transport system ATP-binding protein
MIESAPEPHLLEVDGLTVRARREAILDQVSFNVQRGSLHVIVGPNGAGKSTLLAAILGQISFEGRIQASWTGSGGIGYVPQTFAVDPTLPVTVQDFLALTRQRRPVCLGIAPPTRALIAKLLARVRLPGLEDRPLAVLSGGELKRVLLAHALDPEPELLLLDEPTAGLDKTAVRLLEETLASLTRNSRTTVVMVSHDLEQVRRIADYVTVLDHRVLADGPLPAVLGDAHGLEALTMTTAARWEARR